MLPLYNALMCGRFTRNYTWAQIHAMYSLTSPASNLQPRFGAAIIIFILWPDYKRQLVHG